MPTILAKIAYFLVVEIGVSIAAIDFAIKFAAVALLSSLTSKLFGPKAPGGVGLTGLQVMSHSALEYRKIVYGQAMVSGPVFYKNLSGDNGEYIWYAIKMAQGQSEDLVSVWFDDDEIPKADIDWTAGTGASDGTGTGDVSTSKFVGDNATKAVQIFYYLGDDDQPACGKMVTEFAQWTTSHRARGCTYIVIKLLYDVDTENVWKEGFPNTIAAVFRGRKIYDPRLDTTNGGSGAHRYATPSTWEWSENPSLCDIHYEMDVMGVDPSTSINWPAVAAAADDCEVSVVIPPAASPENTESRFTCNGALSMGSSHKDNLDSILSSMDGKLSYSGGVWKVRASVWESSSVNIDADDLAGPVEVRGSAPKSERFNSVRGFFVDPDRNYEAVEFPHISSASYLSRDNAQLIEFDLQLPMTNTATMAQRVAYRNLEQGDNQVICKLHMNARGAKVAIGDVVSLTLDDLSWSSKKFRCIEWNRNSGGSFSVTLREDDSADYIDPLVSEYGTAGTGGTTIPGDVVPAPTGLTATSGPNSVVLSWNNIPSRLYSHIEIWASDDDVRNNATVIATTPANAFTETMIDNNRIRFYWIRAVNFQDNVSDYEPNTSTTTATAAGFSTTPGVILDPDFDLSTVDYSYWDVNEKEIGSVSRAADANLLIGSGANSSNAWELIPAWTDGTAVGSIVEIITKNRFRLNSGMVEVNIRFSTTSAIVGDGALSGFTIRFEGYDAQQGGAEQIESGLWGLSLDDTSGAWKVARFSVPISDDDDAQFWRVSIGLSNYDVVTDPVFIIDSIFIVSISGALKTTAMETNKGITPTNYQYKPGHLYRYSGPIVFSTTGVAGTDISTAWQTASDSGHPIYIPEGWFSSETLVTIISDGAEGGGKTFTMTAETRIERFTDNSDPIVHIAGDQNHIDFGGGILAARSFGGFTRGLLLYGQDPNAADNTGATEVDTMHGIMKSVKVIGKTSNTGWDGSVGIYLESSSRRRGTFISPAIHSYYGRFTDLYSLQWDYPFFLSTDFNAHTLKGCTALTFGHAGFWVNGYANTFPGCFVESPSAQDSTERGGFVFGNKDSGPEAANKPCEDGATELVIIAITNGSPTIIQTSAAHGESTGNLVKLDNIVDNGPSGDLEAALNTNHYTLTSTGSDTFTIPVDTSGLTNVWASGGTVNTDPYPIIGARANHVVGVSELQFDASTKVTRMFLQDRPGGNADTEKIFRGKFGKNVMDLAGTFPGGIAKDGFSTPASILNNIVNATNAVADYDRPIDLHGFQFRKLDDSSGDSFGTDEFKTYSGRVTDLAESFTYDLLSIDNVGPTNASVLIEVTIVCKEDVGDDHLAGPITFLCPVTAGTVRQAKELTRNFAHFGRDDEPALVPIIIESAGTAANTGKFTVKLATQDITGITADSICTWIIKIIASNLEGTNLDWDNDVKLLTSSTSGLVKDTRWARKTKFKLIDTTKTTDTTLADDPHLNTWDLDADTEYIIQGSLDINAHATPDYKSNFDFSSATQEVRIYQNYGNSIKLATSDSDLLVFTGVTGVLQIHGRFKTHATVGGDLSYRWAQNISDANNTTLGKDSWIKIIRADAMRSELI